MNRVGSRVKGTQRVGTRAQVMHGNARMTAGGLTRNQLKYNPNGKIVSIKASATAKKLNKLVKAGYKTTKGQFGAVKNMRGGGKPKYYSDTGVNYKDILDGVLSSRYDFLKKHNHKYIYYQIDPTGKTTGIGYGQIVGKIQLASRDKEFVGFIKGTPAKSSYMAIIDPYDPYTRNPLAEPKSIYGPLYKTHINKPNGITVKLYKSSSKSNGTEGCPFKLEEEMNSVNVIPSNNMVTINNTVPDIRYKSRSKSNSKEEMNVTDLNLDKTNFNINNTSPLMTIFNEYKTNIYADVRDADVDLNNNSVFFNNSTGMFRISDSARLNITFTYDKDTQIIRISYISINDEKLKGFTANSIIPRLIHTLKYNKISEIIIPEITTNHALCAYLRGLLKCNTYNYNITILGNIVSWDGEEDIMLYFSLNTLDRITGPRKDGKCINNNGKGGVNMKGVGVIIMLTTGEHYKINSVSQSTTIKISKVKPSNL